MEGRPVPASASDVLPWTPEWTKWPDYERVCIAQTQLYWDTRQFTPCETNTCCLQTMWLNNAVKTLWPVYNEAIAKMAIEQAKPQIDAALEGVIHFLPLQQSCMALCTECERTAQTCSKLCADPSGSSCQYRLDRLGYIPLEIRRSKGI